MRRILSTGAHPLFITDAIVALPPVTTPGKHAEWRINRQIVGSSFTAKEPARISSPQKIPRQNQGVVLIARQPPCK